MVHKSAEPQEDPKNVKIKRRIEWCVWKKQALLSLIRLFFVLHRGVSVERVATLSFRRCNLTSRNEGRGEQTFTGSLY